jgi:hypothetical protein
MGQSLSLLLPLSVPNGTDTKWDSHFCFLKHEWDSHFCNKWDGYKMGQPLLLFLKHEWDSHFRFPYPCVSALTLSLERH